MYIKLIFLALGSFGGSPAQEGAGDQEQPNSVSVSRVVCYMYMYMYMYMYN